MAHYIWVEAEIDNRSGAAEYMEKVPGVIAQYGGRYLIRGGETEILEGDLGAYPMKVLIEFPDKDAATRWYDSPEYAEIHGVLKENARYNLLSVSGV